MVASAGTPQRPGGLRALNQPQPVEFRLRTPSPRAERGPGGEVRMGRRWVRVRQVLDTWRIDDEWWREQPVSRMYHQMLLEDGATVTLFQDLLNGRWYRQRV